MLTGDPPHTGASAQQIIMKIIAEPVQLVTAHRKSVPPNVAAAVAKALEKLAADRFESAATFAEALANPAFAFGATTSGRAPDAARMWKRITVAMTALAATLALILAATAPWKQAAIEPDRRVVRFALADDAALRITASTTRPFAVSPDGRTIIFRASTDSAGPRLWVRSIDEPHARPLAGTEGGANAAISPDGQWVAFYGSRGLQKVRITGGEVTRVATLVATAAALSWASNDEILFEQLAATGQMPIHRVSASGGRAEIAIPLDTASKEFGQRRPLMLRDAGIIAYASSVPEQDTAAIVLYRRSDGRRVRLPVAGNSPLGLIDDRLVYARRDGALMVVKIDLKAMRVVGEPFALSTRVASQSTGTAVALSEEGTLVYRTTGWTTAARLSLVDTSGKVRAIPGVLAVQDLPRFSPDGRRLVVGMGADRDFGRQFGMLTTDLWIIDVATGVPTRITTGNNAAAPSWTTDGRHIVYMLATEQRSELWSLPVDVSAPPVRLFATEGTPTRSSAAPDGRSVIFQTVNTQSRDRGLPVGLYRAWTDGSARLDTLLMSVAGGVRPTYVRVSPDGRWVAYLDRGNGDVWVQSLTDRSVLQVSVAASDDQPVVWGPDSRHLYYVQSDGLAAIELRAEPRLSVAQRHTIRGFPANDGYDLSPDGKTFVIVTPLRNSADIFVAVNWSDAARREWSAAKK
jgi:serine/threonine-protein kinase